MAKPAKSSAEQILPLYINGLNGRTLRVPSQGSRKREILLIYGHHASLERMVGLAEYLSKFGNVTMPDLPGFGGMEPFYKIGQKPNLDSMADYLAAFVKLRYRNRRVTIVGLSLGFVYASRMLQKYPELTKKVDLLISVAGFADHRDIIFKPATKLTFKSMAFIFSRRLPAALAHHIALRPSIIKGTYRLVEGRNPKLRGASRDEQAERIKFEVTLWRVNDFRSYAETSRTILKLRLPKARIDLPVHHVAIKNDRYFNNVSVEQHMRLIYSDFEAYQVKLPVHAPSILATAADAAPYIPVELRKLLRRR